VSVRNRLANPSRSRRLGFKCEGRCGGLEYGSIVLESQKPRARRKDRIVSKRNIVDRHRRPSRTGLNPVELSLEKKILTLVEDTWLDSISDTLADPQFYRKFRSLADSRKQRLLQSVKNGLLHLERKAEFNRRHNEELEQKSSRWQVVEEVEQLNSKEYELTKRLGKHVIEDFRLIVDDSGRKEMKKVIVWNPAKEIERYRQDGDPLRQIDFHLDTCAFALGLKFTKEELRSIFESDRLRKGFDIIKDYRKQFSDGNWRYAWREWFWIVRYATFRTPGAASKMLLALDGKDGIITPKHIRDKKEAVLRFWTEYFEYSLDFFAFISKALVLVHESDSFRDQYNTKELIGVNKDQEYIKELAKQHMIEMLSYQEDAIDAGAAFQKQLVDEQISLSNDRNLTKKRPDRIRIFHSNQHYKKEMEEYKRGLRNEKPRRRIVCGPFSPWPLLSKATNLTREAYNKRETELAELANKLMPSF
jgi:hypothetical protein